MNTATGNKGHGTNHCMFTVGPQHAQRGSEVGKKYGARRAKYLYFLQPNWLFNNTHQLTADQLINYGGLLHTRRG